MTLFLASVRDAAEAEMAIGAGADIVDLKDPGQGALGALAPDTIATCVSVVAGRAPVSATIGDLPLQGESVRAAVRATAASGVDYVKLGLFPGGDAERCLNLLKTEAANVRLILVLFADSLPDIDAIGLAARIGACGVMFDTLGKKAGSLPDHISLATLAGLVASAQDQGLTVGLAGSLKAKHVPSLLGLAPDLLGFRGALCQGGDRAQNLDAHRLAAIRALIPESPGLMPEASVPNLGPHALC
jgi:uncharacterized protein (UPF0264 family)